MCVCVCVCVCHLTVIPANVFRVQSSQLHNIDGWLPWVHLNYQLPNINPFQLWISCVCLEGGEGEREREGEGEREGGSEGKG